MKASELEAAEDDPELAQALRESQKQEEARKEEEAREELELEQALRESQRMYELVHAAGDNAFSQTLDQSLWEAQYSLDDNNLSREELLAILDAYDEADDDNEPVQPSSGSATKTQPSSGSSTKTQPSSGSATTSQPSSGSASKTGASSSSQGASSSQAAASSSSCQAGSSSASQSHAQSKRDEFIGSKSAGLHARTRLNSPTN